MTIQDQVEFYNERWIGFQYANRLKLMRCAAILTELGSLGLASPRILDFGCGTGWLSNILGMFGPTTGVDLSNEAIKAASARYPHIHFITENILSWNYTGEPFDVIVAHETIEHVEDQHAYLEIVCKLLRRDGYLILTTPNAPIVSAMPVSNRLGWSNQPIENWLTVPELKNLLSKNYKIVRLQTIIAGYDPKGALRVVNSSSLKKILSRVGILSFYTSLVLRLGFGLHILAVAKKTEMI